MIRVASRNTSQDGLKKRASKIVRLLCLLVAVLTVVGAGITSIGHVGSPLADSANALRSAVAPQAALQWHDDATRPLDHDVVEAALDDDDLDDDDLDDGDTRSDLSECARVAFRGVRLTRGPRRASHGEPQNDPSRFAIGTGFPRGPPA